MSASQDDMCKDHPEEKQRFVCMVCDVLICRDCKLTDHEGHRSIDVVKAITGIKDKLDGHRGRLQERTRTLDSVLREVAEDQSAAALTQTGLEKKIRQRVARVTLWLKQAEESALSSLKTTATKVDRDLSATHADFEQRRNQLQEMIAEVDNMVRTLAQSGEPGFKFSPAAALRLEQDMRTGRGQGENLERLTEGLPNYSASSILQRSDASEGLTELALRSFIGLTLYTQLSKTEPKVALSPVFRFPVTSGACVNALCPMPDGTVWLAHDTDEGDSSKQRIALYNSSDGQMLKEQLVSGRVSIARAGPADWVYCVGNRLVKKVLNRHETRDAISEREEVGRHRAKNDTSDSSGSKSARTGPQSCTSSTLLCKLNARFSLKSYAEASARDDNSGDSGDAPDPGPTYINKSDSLDKWTQGGEKEAELLTTFCKIEARSLPSLWVVSETYFPVTVQLPQAIDADSSGKFFAVLTPVPTPSVMLFQPGGGLPPVARYAPRATKDEAFCPSDLCFTYIEGQEVLVVADWFNSSLHVLEFQDGLLRFKCYLCAGCPLLRQPTALVSDEDHRLWIGCKGGQVLICIANDSESDPETEEEEAPL